MALSQTMALERLALDGFHRHERLTFNLIDFVKLYPQLRLSGSDCRIRRTNAISQQLLD